MRFYRDSEKIIVDLSIEELNTVLNVNYSLDSMRNVQSKNVFSQSIVSSNFIDLSLCCKFTDYIRKRFFISYSIWLTIEVFVKEKIKVILTYSETIPIEMSVTHEYPCSRPNPPIYSCSDIEKILKLGTGVQIREKKIDLYKYENKWYIVFKESVIPTEEAIILDSLQVVNSDKINSVLLLGDHISKVSSIQDLASKLGIWLVKNRVFS
jgi:hypothetical protein